MKIKSITKITDNLKRYDIQTKNHNFFANGILVHNSLIKITRLNDDLLISTNGTIDAYKAPLAEQIGCTAKTFGGLVEVAMVNEINRLQTGKVSLDWCISPMDTLRNMLDENKTYIFELTSPFNKVVVTWHETRLNFIGVRDNVSNEESFFGDHDLAKIFNTPKIFPLRSVDECVKAAAELDCNAEGYVVVDNKFNRVKIKSPTYVSLHHMKNNGNLSYERGIEIVRGNELDEVLTYFPEFKPHLEKIREDCEELKRKLNVANESMNEIRKMETRKEQALNIQKIFGRHSGVGFALLDRKIKDVDEWFMNCPSANLVKILGYKD